MVRSKAEIDLTTGGVPGIYAPLSTSWYETLFTWAHQHAPDGAGIYFLIKKVSIMLISLMVQLFHTFF